MDNVYLNVMKNWEQAKQRHIRDLHKCKGQYFGTLVEDVRELPQYKNPSLMKEFNLADEGILPS